MVSFLVNRLIRSLIVLLSLSLIVFVLLEVSGDPAIVMAPPDTPLETLERMREDWGLNEPLHVRYLHFASKAAVGDFGDSWKYREPALALIIQRIPATLELAGAAALIVLLLSIPLGILAAAARGRWLDTVITSVAVGVRAVPSFWLGLMLILTFAVWLGLVPTSGRGGPESLILPATTLALAFVADILLLLRSGLIETMEEDFVRTARAKGLPERAVYLVHALRAAALPVVSVFGITLGQLLGGAVVTETVFAWPGIGSLALEGLTARDFPLVEASVFLLAVSVAAVNLVIDLSYVVIDPRVHRA